MVAAVGDGVAAAAADALAMLGVLGRAGVPVLSTNQQHSTSR